MDPIDRLITRAARRLTLASAVRALGVTLTVALVAALLTRGAQKLAPIEAPWALLAPSLLAAALVGALAWAWLTRMSAERVAQTIDERAGLHETISTARWVRDDRSAWSGAIVGQAHESVRRVVLKDTVPITAPRLGPAMIVGALVLAVWWAPSVDAAGWFADQEEEQAQAEETERVRGEVRAAAQKLDALLESTSVQLDDGEGDEDSGPEGEVDTPDSPDSLRRSAIKKLTSLRDKVQGAQKSAQAERAEGVREAMRRLRQPGEGPMGEFSRKLARGEFGAAREALEQASRNLDSSDASDEDKARAKEQLENLASQMERLAESKEAMESALEKAGASPEQAKKLAEQLSQNPESALDNLPGIPQDTLQSLREMAQSQAGASEAMQSMSNALQQMAQSQGQQGQGGEGMESMAQQLSEMELAEAEMQNLDAALQEIEGQLAEMSEGMSKPCSMGGMCDGSCGGTCEGSGHSSWWREGDSVMEGMGSGGPGRGMGNGPEESGADYVLEKRKQRVENRGGPIIGSTLVFGDQVRGESRAEFGDAAAAASERAAEAIETNRVPREYEKAVKHYFGRLEARVKAQEAGEKDADG